MTSRLVTSLAAAALLAVPAALAPVGAASAAARPSSPPQKFVRCTFTPTPKNPAARPVKAPPKRTPATGIAEVTVRTNYGPMTFVLQRDAAPCGVANLLSLARQHFFDQSQCWRFTNNARLGVLQCGDIYRQEEGGPGYKFADEVSKTNTYPRGTLAMGNQGAGTNGSEWFVVHSHANIPPNFTILGRMSGGFSRLDKIVKAGTVDADGDGLPTRPVVIYDVRATTR